MSALLALLRRDLVLGYRQGIDAWVVVLFFLAAGILFPFAIGPEPNALMRASTGIVLTMAARSFSFSWTREMTSPTRRRSMNFIGSSMTWRRKSLTSCALARVETWTRRRRRTAVRIPWKSAIPIIPIIM